MSQENVQVALDLLEASNRQDGEAFVALVSPDVVWEDPAFWSEPLRTYRGTAEVRDWFNRVVEPWESLDFEVKEITEGPEDRVFADTLLTARGNRQRCRDSDPALVRHLGHRRQVHEAKDLSEP